jgi:hypothetical protein
MIGSNDVVRSQLAGLPKVDRLGLLYQIAAEYTLARDMIEPRMLEDPRFALLALALLPESRSSRTGELLE